MLTRLILAFYPWLLEVALWLALLVAGFVGYNFVAPAMHVAGVALTPEDPGKIVGALILLGITFVGLAAVVGPILMLMDVRRAVRSIEARLEREVDVRGSLPVERREPSI